jgi:hypothetical protein
LGKISPINSAVEIAPKSFIILTKNKQNFLVKYPLIDSNKIIGDFKFGLPKKGSKILLYDKNELVIDSLSYKAFTLESDSSFTYNLIHPDSATYQSKNWLVESPSPNKNSSAYTNTLYKEEQKRIWKKRLYYGGGFFLYACLV